MRRGVASPPETPRGGVVITFSADGVVFSPPLGAADDWRRSAMQGADAEIGSFVAQIQELGWARRGPEGAVVMPWRCVYRVLEQDDLSPIRAALPLPEVDAAVVPS